MCTISKKKVKWSVDPEFIKEIKISLNEDNFEKAGSILFRDTECKNGICNKESTKIKIKNGGKSSVFTPEGIINFHTHPRNAYKSQEAVFGWPSGEDMAQCINFAKEGTLVHIVFTLEGAYIIKVNKILNKQQTKILEDVFKETHVYRSSNQATQLKNFKKKFRLSGVSTLELWLNLANQITLTRLYELYNFINKKSLKVPKDDINIFEVNLTNINKTLVFNANYIQEKCHALNFNKQFRNSLS